MHTVVHFNDAHRRVGSSIYSWAWDNGWRHVVAAHAAAVHHYNKLLRRNSVV